MLNYKHISLSLPVRKIIEEKESLWGFDHSEWQNKRSLLPEYVPWCVLCDPGWRSQQGDYIWNVTLRPYCAKLREEKGRRWTVKKKKYHFFLLSFCYWDLLMWKLSINQSEQSRRIKSIFDFSLKLAIPIWQEVFLQNSRLAVARRWILPWAH